MPLLSRRRLDSAALKARLAGIIGAVLLGLVAIGFARAGEVVQALFSGFYHLHPWLAAASTPLVFLAVVGATRRWFPAARGSGIPQVMAAQHNPTGAVNGPLLSLRTAMAKMAGTLAAKGRPCRSAPR
jgi:H+/Cl- antiporter ClcA